MTGRRIATAQDLQKPRFQVHRFAVPKWDPELDYCIRQPTYAALKKIQKFTAATGATDDEKLEAMIESGIEMAVYTLSDGEGNLLYEDNDEARATLRQLPAGGFERFAEVVQDFLGWENKNTFILNEETKPEVLRAALKRAEKLLAAHDEQTPDAEGEPEKTEDAAGNP